MAPCACPTQTHPTRAPCSHRDLPAPFADDKKMLKTEGRGLSQSTSTTNHRLPQACGSHVSCHRPTAPMSVPMPKDLRRRQAEATPVKDSHTRIKPCLTNGQRPRPSHSRCARPDTCVRWGMAVACGRCEFLTVSLPKRLRNGRFTHF